MFSTYSPFSPCLSPSPPIHFLSTTVKLNTHFNCKNSQQGVPLLAPLPFPSFTHFNSYPDRGRRRPSQSCLHVETLRSAIDRGTIQTNEENQHLDPFNGNRRQLAKENVEDENFMANEKGPKKVQEGFVDAVDMGSPSAEDAETDSTRLKECRRMNLESSNSGRWARDVDNFDLSGNGRIPTKDRVVVVSSVKNNSELLAQDEIGHLDFEKNGRGSPSCSIGTVDSVDRSGRSSLPISIGTAATFLATKNEAEFAECAAKTQGGFDTQEETEIVVPLTESVGSDCQYVGEKYGRLAGDVNMKVVDRIRRIPAGEQGDVHDLLARCHEHPTLFDFNNLLIALVKANRPESAASLFSNISSYGLSPNSWTFSIMVQCFCANKEPDEARDILQKMIENGLCPDVVTFTILIDAFCKRGRLQKVFEIFNIMHQIGCEPTIQTYNCLVKGLCFVGRIEEAYELLTKIKNSTRKPDIYTFTAVMDGFCKVGCSNQAMELLEEAKELGLKPTVVTFNTLFDGYCREGRPLDGFSLLRKMEKEGCQPDSITYSTLLHGLVKWNKTYSALDVYKTMSQAGFKPDERVMGTLLRRLCRKSLTDGKLLRDAEELFWQIREMGSGPTPQTCCSMIQALAVREKMDEALSILHHMTKTGNPPSAITYTIVIQALCNHGRADDAWLVLVLLINRRGPFPSRTAYNLLLDELDRQGRLSDSRKVYALALKRGVFLHPKSNVGFGKESFMKLL
ncbi:hypothetical protein ACLOJK_031466 [Asimina triloba]